MKTLKNYLKMAFFAIISLSTALAFENDTFGENIAKAVLFHWSPKPEHIKTVANDARFDHNQENEYEDNTTDDSFLD
jgi:hypothetical protein